MKSLIKDQAERFVRKKKIFKRWLAAVLCLALIVTMGTFAALTQNGRALDHTHTAECYDADGNLICNESELEGEAADADAAAESGEALDAAGETATADGTAVADGTADGTGAEDGTDAAGATGIEASDETGADGTDGIGTADETGAADGSLAADGEEAAAVGTDETGSTDDAQSEDPDADESDHAAVEEEYDIAAALTYEDENITVKASAKTENAIPEGTTLRVTPILEEAEETEEQYAKVEEQLLAKAAEEEYEIAGFLAYDITLLDKDGNEIEPDGDVKVSFEYKEAAIPEGVADVISGALEDAAVDAAADEESAEAANEGAAEAADGNAADTTEAADNATTDITVFHLEEDENGEVEDVVDLGAEDENKIEALETTDAQEVEKVEFVADGFSVYTITWTKNGNSKERAEGTVKLVLINESGQEITSSEKTETLKVGDAYKISEIAGSDITDDAGIKYYYDRAVLDVDCADQPAEENGDYTFNNVITNGTIIYKIKYKEKVNKHWYYTTSEETTAKESNLSSTSNTIYIYLVYSTKDKSALTPVETVTNSDITIRMVDWEQQEFSGGDWNGDAPQPDITQGLLKNKLTTSGYPEFTDLVTDPISNTFEGLFDSSTNVNKQLFIKDEYDTTGYYYFNAEEYGAFYDGESGNFAVYEEKVSPKDKTLDMQDGKNMHGAFLPYNTITKSVNNQIPETSDGWTSLVGTDIYYPNEDVNFWFGMEISTSFHQMKDGKVNGEAITYEFAGDDDLWVYIDGVLVLDLGGIHDSADGKIDFSTGKVYIQSGKALGDSLYKATEEEGYNYETTIYQLFEAASAVNTVEWKDVVDENGTVVGKTFADYSSHTFKMWYLERGEGNSNLKFRFNFLTVPEGAVDVTKQLANTDKEKYADVEFAFQLYAQIPNEDENYDKNGTDYALVTSNKEDGIHAINKETGEEIEFQTYGEGDNQKEGVFFLKPGETAQFFGMKMNQKYYVVELGIKPSEYSEVLVNGKKVYGFTGDYYDENGEINWSEALYEESDVKSLEKTVEEQQLVLFTNSCSELNRNELKITKALGNVETTDDTFSFRIYLESTEGNLEAYEGAYYVVDKEGNYYKEETDNNGNVILQNTKNSVDAVVCGTTSSDGIVEGVPAGCTVVITQILSGTEFKVKEIVDSESNWSEDYLLELKDDSYEPVTEITEGVSDENTGMVADGAIKLGTNAEVTITNYLKQSIQVEKSWPGGAPSDGTEILVGLYCNETPTENYVTLKKDDDWTGNFGSEILTGKTDSYTVKELREAGNGETAEFTVDDCGYVGVEDNETLTIGDITYHTVQETKQDTDNEALQVVTIVNAPVWTIKKVSAASNDLSLSDAVFEMQSSDEETGTYYGKSNADGFIEWYREKPKEDGDESTGTAEAIQYLPDGTYTLSEITAPLGYSVSTEKWIITIENGYAISIRSGEDSVERVDGTYVYLYKDTALYSLPEAGGPGIYIYTIAGMLLMMAGAFVLYKRRGGAAI